MDCDRPYFSVITPSFNQGEYLEGTIRSVLAQEDPDFEHLIFDNCSTDATPAVLAKYPHLQVRTEKDRGQSNAINKGLSRARGEIICWLNSDDQYPAGTFAALREAFADPGCRVVYGDALQVSFDGSSEAINHGCFEDRRDLITWWRRRVKLHQPAIFFRRAVVAEIGLLREDLHFVMDYEYWWRMSAVFEFRHLPRVLAIQQRQPESKTVRDPAAMYRERERVFKPFYGELHRSRAALAIERRRVMGGRYLESAFHLSRRNRPACRQLLLLAAGENPFLMAHPTWLGALARAAGGPGVARLLDQLLPARA